MDRTRMRASSRSMSPSTRSWQAPRPWPQRCRRAAAWMLLVLVSCRVTRSFREVANSWRGLVQCACRRGRRRSALHARCCRAKPEAARKARDRTKHRGRTLSNDRRRGCDRFSNGRTTMCRIFSSVHRRVRWYRRMDLGDVLFAGGRLGEGIAWSGRRGRQAE